MDPFKVPIIKAEYAKNVFGGHFPTEHNSVTDNMLQYNVSKFGYIWIHCFSHFPLFFLFTVLFGWNVCS